MHGKFGLFVFIIFLNVYVQTKQPWNIFLKISSQTKIRGKVVHFNKRNEPNVRKMILDAEKACKLSQEVDKDFDWADFGEKATIAAVSTISILLLPHLATAC